MYSVFTTILLSLAMCPQNIWGKGDEASYKALETLAKGIYYLETMYVDEKAVDTKQLVDNALIGMAEKLDPHTVIMPRKAFEQLAVDTKGKFGGVGIIVSHESGQLVVVSPIDDTPAARAGIRSGDKIVQIDSIEIDKELQ